MYRIHDKTADYLVGVAEAEMNRLESLMKMATDEGAKAQMRDRIYDLKAAVAGLNTGQGVTRQDIRLDGTYSEVFLPS